MTFKTHKNGMATMGIMIKNFNFIYRTILLTPIISDENK